MRTVIEENTIMCLELIYFCFMLLPKAQSQSKEMRNFKGY